MSKQEIEKAIYKLASYDGTEDKELQNAIEIAVPTLEKQLARKPLEIRNKHDFQGNVILKDGYCPNCKHEMSNAYLFCNKCGQAVDWGNEDE